MITGKEDLLQSLIEAFLMEKGTKEFYVQAAEISSNGNVKRMFSELGRWEEKHMDYIQHLYQSVQGDINAKSFEAFKEREEAPLTESGIPVKDLKERVEKYSIKDENNALSLAMEIEGKAYNFYRKLSQNAVNSNAKVFFGEMKDQEVKHIDYLKNMRGELKKG